MASRLSSSITITLLLTLSACGSSGSSNDALPQRLVEVTRSLSDSSIETITTEYSESGNISGQIFRRNGAIYLTTTFETNAQGQFLRRSDDTDQDGVENRSSSYGYTSGLGLTRINRTDSNMLIDRIEFFTFDGGLAVSRDTRSVVEIASPDLVDEFSGTLTTQRIFGYENGRIITNDIDTDGDGDIDRQETYSYNPDGTLATTTVSSVSEGVLSSATHTYERGLCTNNSGNSSTSYFCVVSE